MASNLACCREIDIETITRAPVREAPRYRRAEPRSRAGDQRHPCLPACLSYSHSLMVARGRPARPPVAVMRRKSGTWVAPGRQKRIVFDAGVRGHRGKR